MTAQKNDGYLLKYLEVLTICQKCNLYFEADEECLVNEENIMSIIKSDYPMCPIGEW